MSTTASVANFYVDHDGHEQPIRFKASDLVNKLAPIGYHWEQATKMYNVGGHYGIPDRWVEMLTEDYICVKDKDNG
jgi:hypothetical protein